MVRHTQLFILYVNYIDRYFILTHFFIFFFPDLMLSDDEIKNLALLDIEKFLLRNSCSLRHFVGMPYPENEFLSLLDNRLICEELGYDSNSLVEEFDSQFSSLTDEQKNIYNCVIKSVEEKKGGVFFLFMVMVVRVKRSYGRLYLHP